MEVNTAAAIVRRARRRLAHSLAQGETATTERAAMRHARRVRSARQLLGYAEHEYEALAFEPA